MTDNNILIALFMGWRIDNSFPDKDKVYRGPTGGLELDTTFKYHKSWDWLMPVYLKVYLKLHELWNKDKTELMEFVQLSTRLMQCTALFGHGEINNVKDEESMKGEVYETVVQFIKWYNKNN